MTGLGLDSQSFENTRLKAFKSNASGFAFKEVSIVSISTSYGQGSWGLVSTSSIRPNIKVPLGNQAEIERLVSDNADARFLEQRPSICLSSHAPRWADPSIDFLDVENANPLRVLVRLLGRRRAAGSGRTDDKAMTAVSKTRPAPALTGACGESWCAA
jgi:hypothetical protein